MKETILTTYIIGIIIVIALMGSAMASSSSSVTVNFTVGYVNNSINTSFNSTVSNLVVKNKSIDSIAWSWKNPSEQSFSHNLIFLNGVLVASNANEIITLNNLHSNTLYTISVVCIDNLSNRGPSTRNSVKTLSVENNNKHWTHYKNTNVDINPFLSTSNKRIINRNATIELNGFSFSKTNAHKTNLLTILILLLFILILLVAITVIVNRKKISRKA